MNGAPNCQRSQASCQRQGGTQSDVNPGLGFIIEPPGGCRTLGTRPQVQRELTPQASGGLYLRGRMRQGQFLQLIHFTLLMNNPEFLIQGPKQAS